MSKVTINFSGLGLDGRAAEKLLRQQHIEVEMTAGNHVLAFISLGDTMESVNRLLAACQYIAAMAPKTQIQALPEELPLPQPEVVMAPVDVWHARREAVPLETAVGKIAAETVMFYPPGVPVVAMGERITLACVSYIQRKMAAGYSPNGPADERLQTIQVIRE